jgi:hypothetical protein
MALLPLAAALRVNQARPMSNTDPRTPGKPSVIRQIARSAADLVAECNYAQRRLMHLRLSLDSYVYDPHHVPSTYGEFLYRTAGTPRREPSARDRAAGQPHSR